MKKIIKIVLIIVGLLAVIIIALLLYHQSYKVWGATKKYSYQKLDYISGDFPVKDKSFVFGVAFPDIWGDICNKIWCDDPQATIEPTFQRLKSINANLVVIPDVALLSNDLKVDFFPAGKSSPQTKDTQTLKELTASAKNNNLRTMLMTNIIDLHREVGAQINWQEPDWNLIDPLFNDWQRIVQEQAKKAQEAQFDYMVMNPGGGGYGFGFPNSSDQERVDQKYLALIPKIKSEYHGKLCLWEQPHFIQNKTLVESVDCIVALPNIFTKTPIVTEDVGSIQKAWESWFNLPELKIFSGKELFITISAPSYDGAMYGGWVEDGLLDHPPNQDPRDAYSRDWKEQALVYEGFFRAIYENNFPIKGVIADHYWYNDRLWPESSKIKELRPDIGPSIRSKDAEHVFYQWTQILK